ncbi:DinB family protein [Citricoccus sp. SGAir0253]|uniref:DinB family protein n=1 Tax=Citricoccus sp. SGAir0253 TaxID=2567881 RepID=UPI0010CCC2C1|nr:DinB family protein [Citricoccus sp. SGAir0253]QCU79117.1 DinB family protein [Citricoccus sp. SGAir0253]
MTGDTPPAAPPPAPAPSGAAADGGLKPVLEHYLRAARRDLRWKLEGLTERQLRMPMTPTGTNLLGVLKHVASVEAGYFTDCLGRPSGIPMPWFEDGAEPNADMFATAEESVQDVLDLADRCAAASDAVIAELDLAAVATVPWWSRPEVTLGRLLVHVVAEYQRHLGHVDIVRELLDGRAGLAPAAPNLPGEDQGVDAAWWAAYTERLRALAEGARG